MEQSTCVNGLCGVWGVGVSVACIYIYIFSGALSLSLFTKNVRIQSKRFGSKSLLLY